MSPLTVRAWPNFPDTRGPNFSLAGFAWGQVPPFKFFMVTTGAFPPFEELNDGVVITSFIDDDIKTVYEDVASKYTYIKQPFDPPQPGPPEFSVVQSLTLQPEAGTVYTGQIDQFFPDAIQMLTIPVSVNIGAPGLIPNPVVLHPRPWNFAA